MSPLLQLTVRPRSYQNPRIKIHINMTTKRTATATATVTHIAKTPTLIIVTVDAVTANERVTGEPVGSVWIKWESHSEQVETSCCDDHLRDKTWNLSTDMPNNAKQGQLPPTPNTSAPLPQGNALVAQTEQKSQGLRKSEKKWIMNKRGCSG